MNCPFTKEQLTASNGMLLTQGLFYEYRFQGEADPIYTLKEHDWNKCKSMYLIYMSCESEYEAAIKLLGSWSHWRKLCQCSWFKPYIDSWREEVEIREAAIGKKTLIEQAELGSVSAAKELYNQVKKKGTSGRPSKKDKEDEKRKMSAVNQRVISLLDRVPNV